MKTYCRFLLGFLFAGILPVSAYSESSSQLYVLRKATPTPILEPEPKPTLMPFPFTIADATGLPELTNRSVLHPFSNSSADENGVTIQAAGFGAYPIADVSFGYLPVDNAFDGATDGQGVIIQADPGEGAMILGAKIEDKQAALIRCSVRADRPSALVTIASIGSAPDRFIATNYPDNEAYFNNQYMRLQTFCVPPSAGFQPVIQVVNTSQTESLTVYLDNFDVYFIDPNRYYSGNFLDGDEIDPPASRISFPIAFDAGFTDSDFGLKVLASIQYNTKMHVSWNTFYQIFDWIVLQRSLDGSTWEDVYRMIGWFAGNYFSDSGLKPKTKYYYRICVYRWFEWSYSSAVSDTTVQ